MKLLALTLFLPAFTLISSCEKAATSSTTYVTNEVDSASNNGSSEASLQGISGSHSTGKIYIRYAAHQDEMKKWTIPAPFEINITPGYLEVNFTGVYYLDGEPTGPGKKRLFIKQSTIHSVFLSEE